MRMIAFTPKMQKFVITGFSAALVNILLMLFFVEILGCKTYLLKNLANVLAIALSTIYNFVACRFWAWNEVAKKQGGALATQFFLFIIVNIITMLIRAILFAWLDKIGIFYIVNVILGIGLAASISFILYDKIVFKN